ncbi:hypothetical protein ABZ307_41320, partial [Streptomyces griseorubiginosus]|uniref:hypothetical protein n=1 Tax=Streptomyces griseorubiginosus TaxID=67304 RepID=UPI0033BE7DB6
FPIAPRPVVPRALTGRTREAVPVAPCLLAVPCVLTGAPLERFPIAPRPVVPRALTGRTREAVPVAPCLLAVP